MKLKRILMIMMPIALVAVVAIRLMNNKKSADEKVYRYDPEKAIQVRADTLKAVMAGSNIHYSGTFEPNRETKLSAEIQGKINAVYADAGSHVKKGQNLLQLDNALLELQLRSVELQIEGLEADVRRYTILSREGAIQGVQLEKAELGLKSARVQKASLQEQISKSTVRAPFDGIITAKMAEEGAFAAPGMPLLQLTDIARLKFTVNLPEQQLKEFVSGQIYEVTADIEPDLIFKGKVILSGSKGNMGGSFPVQLLVDNTADLKIKSGMFGKVTLYKENSGKHIVIPAAAVQGSASEPEVYIIRDGRATRRPVRILKRLQTQVVVAEGLEEGDVLITGGFINLFEGANVTVK